VLTGTIFHGTKISVRTWVFVLLEVAASKNSVSAWEISRKYSITNESAWHMLHRIREAVTMEPVIGLLDAEEFLRRMLAVSPEDAEKVRERTPGTRPDRQTQEGPSADYGDDGR
jgi:hypothetical protein